MMSRAEHADGRPVMQHFANQHPPFYLIVGWRYL